MFYCRILYGFLCCAVGICNILYGWICANPKLTVLRSHTSLPTRFHKSLGCVSLKKPVFLYIHKKQACLLKLLTCSVEFSRSLSLTLCDPMIHSTPGHPSPTAVSTQAHGHWVDDDIQPSHLLLSTSPPTFRLYQYQDLFKWVSSLHQVAKVLAFQLQRQFFQWTPRTDLL